MSAYQEDPIHYSGTHEELCSEILSRWENAPAGFTLGMDYAGNFLVEHPHPNHASHRSHVYACVFYKHDQNYGYEGLTTLQEYVGADKDGIHRYPKYDEHTREYLDGLSREDEQRLEQYLVEHLPAEFASVAELQSEDPDHYYQLTVDFVDSCTVDYTRAQLLERIGQELSDSDILIRCIGKDQLAGINPDTEKGIIMKKSIFTQTVRRTGAVPLVFTGGLLAYDHDRPNKSSGYPADIWSEYCLYETDGGNYVLEVVTHSNYQGSGTRYDAVVAKTPLELYNKATEEVVHDSDKERDRVIALFEEAELPLAETIE